MNAEKVLKDALLIDQLTKNNLEAQLLIHGIIEDMKSEIRKSSARSPSVYKEAMKILKQAANRLDMAKSYKKDGIQYFCDGCELYAMIDHIPLPEFADDENHYDLYSLMCKVYHPGEKLDVPPLASIKADVKIRKAECGKGSGKLYDFGEGKPVVDVEKLIRVLTIIPDAELFMSENGSNCGICAKDENGNTAVLMPIRIANDMERGEGVK